MMVMAGTLILLGFGFNAWSQNSILSEDNWYKISVEETGIHKITYNDLVSWGIDPIQLNPQNLRLYGNGNGMLPEPIDEFRYQDLQENAIFVFGEDDGNFDTDDYILFYGEGPIEWNMDSETGLFNHETNLYTTHISYFLNFDIGEGKRIETEPSSNLNESGFSNVFDDYYVHEWENINLIHSGKDWYGEEFNETLSHSFQIEFPNLKQSAAISISARGAARSIEASLMSFVINDEDALELSFTGINYYSHKFAAAKEGLHSMYNLDDILNLQISYQQPNDSSVAWLDYFEFNARRHLIFEQGQMSYRDKMNSAAGDIIKFKVYTENENITIWKITDPMNINSQEYEVETDGVFYKTEVDGLEEFIIFDETEYLIAEFEGEVENQNLHAMQPVDLMIISHEDFIDQAEEFSQLHQTTQGISTEVIELQKIYNEFSSGVQDVTAIRDFIKYIYDKQLQPTHMNVMLVGNASYDYLDRIENNTNFIPLWQSMESLLATSSVGSDDYFGLFEHPGNPEVGLGRLPVNTVEEADILVDKITHYITNQSTMGDWRNKMAFVADDEDGNLHLEQTETLIDDIVNYKPAFNLSKIYLDAYEQQELPEGPRYPQVNEAITQQVNTGVSILNYVGHGGNLGWAHERVFLENDLNNWENEINYPIVIGATAEFVRFDDPEIISLGYKSLIKENAGAISVISPNRISYAQSNFAFLQRLYEALCQNNITQGEIMKIAKNSNNLTHRGFHLIGDPALYPAIAYNEVVTETINNIPIEEYTDTIHPGEQIAISGFVTDEDENILSNFNGTLFLKVYDPVTMDSTLANDENSWVVAFETQEEVIYEMETEVVNGQFNFEFNLPNNSYPEIGDIKLSYYANDELEDATGYYNGIAVGGLAGTNHKHLYESDFIQFYPTVVSNMLNFEIESEISNLEISIYNLQGLCVKQISHNDYQKGNEGNIDVSDLSGGMYIIKATSSTFVQSTKILKQ